MGLFNFAAGTGIANVSYYRDRKYVPDVSAYQLDHSVRTICTILRHGKGIY